VVEIEEVDENCSKLQNCGGGFGSIFGRNFGSVFGVHFCPFFGQFSIADLLVLRGFLSVEGGFWAFFRRVFDRPFGHDFATFHLGGVMVVRLLASVGLLVDDSYKGR
jgi:hypothetical protein